MASQTEDRGKYALITGATTGFMAPSREAGERIDRSTGGIAGDYESHEDNIHFKA